MRVGWLRRLRAETQGKVARRRLVIVAFTLGLIALSAFSGRDPDTALRVNRAVVPPPTNSTVEATTTTVPSTATSAAAAATTTTGRPAPPTTTPLAPAPAIVAARPPVAGGGVAIGDSVLEDVQLYAPATLTSHGISINGSVGRQWGTGEAMFSSLRASGKLPAVVVVGLGTNGRIGPADFDAMMRAVAGAKRVVFMTVTGPYASNNPVIRAGVAHYAGVAALADWATLAASHRSWFAKDGVHIGPAGATALGNLLASVA
jgi:hypothetical protein